MTIKVKDGFLWFKLYAAEFLLTTSGMGTEQTGALILLLCRAWLNDERGVLPADDALLAEVAKLTPERWQAIKHRVLSKFEFDAERMVYVSKMLCENWADCEQIQERSKKAATKRWKGEKNVQRRSGKGNRTPLEEAADAALQQAGANGD
jgi:uncharacterized protein YdaU (DUF1376 family)